MALRTADWAQVIELLKASAPPAGRPNLDFLARQLAGFAAGMQAVETHDLSKAEESSARFDAELWRMSQQSKDSPGMQNDGSKATRPPASLPKLQVMPDALLQPLLSSLSVMSLELRASSADGSEKDRRGEKSVCEGRARRESSRLSMSLPSYIRPVGETEGAAMMAAGDWADARAAYERALLERPRSGLRALRYCDELARSLAIPKQPRRSMQTFSAWKDADPALAQVTHAHIYLAEHLDEAGGQR